MDEKRTVSRVATRLSARFRISETPDVLPEVFAVAQDGEADDTVFAGSKLPDAVIAFMKGMDAKLDAVLSLLQEDRLAGEYPHELDVVEISGNGLKGRLHGDIPEGAHLELVLVLSRLPFKAASAIGRVVRQEDDGEKAFTVLEFTRIRESDLEHIVGFVFKEERERIRESIRENKGSTGKI
jgi:hypothetical protein